MARSTTRCAAQDRRVRVRLGLASLTILLLVWKAWWCIREASSDVRRAASRTLYPIVIGLGGRWLGALITTLVGAAAGGDLLLLTFDISRDRQVGDQSALMT